MTVEHRDLVEALLWSLAAELRGHRLGYQAEVAMALVAYLHAATGRLDRLVAAAERLGSDQWMPIVALAKTALAAGRRDLALEVFAAANRPGLQQDYLASRCLELTGQPPPAATSSQSSRPCRVGDVAARLAIPHRVGGQPRPTAGSSPPRPRPPRQGRLRLVLGAQ